MNGASAMMAERPVPKYEPAPYVHRPRSRHRSHGSAVPVPSGAEDVAVIIGGRAVDVMGGAVQGLAEIRGLIALADLSRLVGPHQHPAVLTALRRDFTRVLGECSRIRSMVRRARKAILWTHGLQRPGSPTVAERLAFAATLGPRPQPPSA